LSQRITHDERISPSASMRMRTSGRSGATSNVATMSSSLSARQPTPRSGSRLAGAHVDSTAVRPAAERVVSSSRAYDELRAPEQPDVHAAGAVCEAAEHAQ
jgi:hypothetical protein